MGSVTLVTGGSRSGKSAFAQQLGEEGAGPRLFLATCPVIDPEMAGRIRRHVQDRQQGGWETVEETIDLAGQLRSAHHYATVLIDCLTLWVNNLQYEAEQAAGQIDEDTIRRLAQKLLEAAREHPGEIIMVTNEVGLGIVPDNAAARLYRDLVGRCNQCIGREADKVFLVSCGIAQQIKG